MISVIVPVFNVEKYINECVDSIVGQSYTEIEIVLVDDGSSDNSGQICDNYGKRDNRVKVVHKKNGGPSEARNYGMKAASGEWITFIDGDDVLDRDCLATVYEIANQTDSDVVQFNMTREKEKLGLNRGDMEVYDRDEALKNLFIHHNIIDSVCAKLYRRDVLAKEIDFPVGKLHEDTAITYKVLSQAKKVVVISKDLYWYRIREGSTMHSRMTERNLAILDIPNEIREYLGEDALKFKNEIDYYEYGIKLMLINRILPDKGNMLNGELVEELCQDVIHTSNPYMTKKNIIAKGMIQYARSAYSIMCKWYLKKR